MEGTRARVEWRRTATRWKHIFGNGTHPQRNFISSIMRMQMSCRLATPGVREPTTVCFQRWVGPTLASINYIVAGTGCPCGSCSLLENIYYPAFGRFWPGAWLHASTATDFLHIITAVQIMRPLSGRPAPFWQPLLPLPLLPALLSLAGGCGKFYSNSKCVSNEREITIMPPLICRQPLG